MPCSPYPINTEIQTKNFPSDLLPFETQIQRKPNLFESLSLPHLCPCLSRNFSHLQLACFLSQFTKSQLFVSYDEACNQGVEDGKGILNHNEDESWVDRHCFFLYSSVYGFVCNSNPQLVQFLLLFTLIGYFPCQKPTLFCNLCSNLKHLWNNAHWVL